MTRCRFLALVACVVLFWANAFGQAPPTPYAIYNVTTYPGTTVSAQINAAAADCSSHCILKIPGGVYTLTTSIGTIPPNIVLEGEGRNATTILWNAAGPMITLGDNTSLRRLSIIVGPDARGDVVQIAGEFTEASELVIAGTASAPTTGTSLFNVKTSASGNPAGRARIHNVNIFDFTGEGIRIGCSTDTLVRDVSAYAAASGTTGATVVIDSGARGVHLTDITGGNTQLVGLMIQNKATGTGQCGTPPSQIFVDDLIADNAPPGSEAGEGLVIDSSIGASVVQLQVTNSWFAGLTNGVRISAGQGINISNSIIRANLADGLLINSANASHVKISNNMFQQNCNAGIEITANASVSVLANTSGAVVDTQCNATGTQQHYGLAVALSSSSKLMVLDNDFSGNISQGLYFAGGSPSPTAIVANNAQ